MRQVGAIILLFGFYASAGGAYPYVGDGLDDETSNWYTTNRVEAYGWDIDTRLDGDERVFAANPLYVVDSDHRLVADMSRRYYLFEGWPNTTVTHQLGVSVAADLRSDRVPMAIMTSELRAVLEANSLVNETFHEEFCYVEDPLYELSDDESLWVKTDHPWMPECGSTVDRSDFVMDQVQ